MKHRRIIGLYRAREAYDIAILLIGLRRKAGYGIPLKGLRVRCRMYSRARRELSGHHRI